MAPQGAEASVPLALAAASATNACDTELDLEGLLFCPPRASRGQGLVFLLHKKNPNVFCSITATRHSTFAYLRVWPLISYSNESMGTLCQQWPSAGPINV